MYHRSAGSPVRRSPLIRYATAGLAITALAVLGWTVPPAGAATTTNHAPIGHLDAVRAEPGGVRVVGWAGDLDTPHTSLDFEMDFGPGAGYASRTWIAHDPRPDVASAHPSLGQYHGLNLFSATKPGSYSVCVKALDSAGGPATQLGCVRVSVPAERSAIGHLDSVRSVGNNHITITGWGADQDTPDRAVSINVVLGSRYMEKAFNDIRLAANQSRPDVASVYPALGANHGFALTVATRPGSYPVCAYAFDTYLYGGVTFIGCVTVTV